MAFFKDLGKKIGEVAQDAQNKTSELIETTKLNSAIRDEKEAITALHQKIGLTMYARFAAGDPVPDIVIPDVEAIALKMKTIMGLEAKIVEIKNDDAKPAVAAVPQEPAAPVEKEAPSAAEPEAAASVVQAEPAAEPEAEATAPVGRKFCTNCGSPLTPGTVFCGQCGQKNG